MMKMEESGVIGGISVYETEEEFPYKEIEEKEEGEEKREEYSKRRKRSGKWGRGSGWRTRTSRSS